MHRTALEAFTFDARLGTRSVFILDPRLRREEHMNFDDGKLCCEYADGSGGKNNGNVVVLVEGR